MAKAPLTNTAVPLSHRLRAGTLGQRSPGRDDAGTGAGTADLKTLARLVLARDIRRDSSRDVLSHGRPAASTKVGQSGQGFSTADRPPAEVEEQRAANVERDGKIPRVWAEGFARLDPDRPPGDVPLRRWQRFIDDVGLFLGSPFCAVAAALGWGPYELFGCDRDKPFARIDQCGLLWLLDGNRLIALAENTATTETKTGARQTFRCHPSEAGRVLAWELAP